MNTIIYLIRHSEKLRIKNQKTFDSLLLRDEKRVLTVEGELKSKQISEMEELSNIDLVVSSHYSRAVATAKYIAYRNNLEINVNSNFGERNIGVENYNDLPLNFEIKQFRDENYKVGTGESRKETYNRMITDFMYILNENKGKRITIVFHATAIMFLLQKWCKIDFDGNNFTVYFKDKKIFDRPYKSPEIFKLEFNENNELLNLENIKY